MKKIVSLALVAVMGLGLFTYTQAAEKGYVKVTKSGLPSEYKNTTVVTQVEKGKAHLLSEVVEKVISAKDTDDKFYDYKLKDDAFVLDEEEAITEVTATYTKGEETKATAKKPGYILILVDKKNKQIAQETYDYKEYFIVSSEAKALIEGNKELKGKYDFESSNAEGDLVHHDGKKLMVITATVTSPAEKTKVQYKAFDMEGRSLFVQAFTSEQPLNTFVTARQVAEKYLAGYWVLSEDKVNDQPIYLSKAYNLGGTDFIPAYYEVAKAKQPLAPTTTAQATKPGQVAKTGELASVATGIGAILTLAGAAFATIKRR